MDKPQPIHYNSEYKTVVLEDPKQLISEQGIPCIDGGTAKIDGKMMKYAVRYDNKPALAAQVAEWQAAWQKYQVWKAAEFANNVPGLMVLEAAQDAAYNDDARYDAEFERMMNSENERTPKARDITLGKKAQELAKKYPRAAMYLRAKGYTYASNVDKYGAGKKAMELIASGGDLNEAASILINWVPAEAIWN